MNEIADYIVKDMKNLAIRLCDGDRFMADDLIQTTALKCIQFFSVHTLPFERQKAIAITTMKHARFDMYHAQKKIKVVEDIPYWVAEEKETEYNETIDRIMKFVKQGNQKYMEAYLLYLYGYKVAKITEAMKISTTSCVNMFRRARNNIKRTFLPNQKRMRKYNKAA